MRRSRRRCDRRRPGGDGRRAGGAGDAAFRRTGSSRRRGLRSSSTAHATCPTTTVRRRGRRRRRIWRAIAARGAISSPPTAGRRGEQLSLADEADDGDDPEAAIAFARPEARSLAAAGAASSQADGPDGDGESPEAIERSRPSSSRRSATSASRPGSSITVSGPRVTRYELQLAPGTKVSKVSSLKDDIAYALAATDIRIQAPIPGKSAVGVEVPNKQPSFVALGDIYGDFPRNSSPLAFWLGQDISGKAVLADLTRLVHVLIAGTTGSGKSQCINGIITSILLRATPDQVRLILIDPKKVELSHFDGVPHLLAPVVTQHKMASAVLQNVVHEMERRYEFMLSTDNAQNIKELNKKLEPHGRAADALHRDRRRRARRPDDGRTGRGRACRHPAGSDGARRRHPHGGRDAAPLGRRGHRPDQDQRARRASPSPCRRRPTRA